MGKEVSKQDDDGYRFSLTDESTDEDSNNGDCAAAKFIQNEKEGPRFNFRGFVGWTIPLLIIASFVLTALGMKELFLTI
jgi:hypothetical protein